MATFFKNINFQKILNLIIAISVVAATCLSAFNALTLNNIQPLISHQGITDLQVEACEKKIETEIADRKAADDLILRTIVEKFSDQTTRLNAIASRLGAVQDALIRK